MVNSFRQVKCIVKDPNLGNLKKIAFSNANFFINCPEYRITRYENPAIDSFQGLKLNADNDARTIFKGSSIFILKLCDQVWLFFREQVRPLAFRFLQT